MFPQSSQGEHCQPPHSLHCSSSIGTLLIRHSLAQKARPFESESQARSKGGALTMPVSAPTQQTVGLQTIQNVNPIGIAEDSVVALDFWILATDHGSNAAVWRVRTCCRRAAGGAVQ